MSEQTPTQPAKKWRNGCALPIIVGVLGMCVFGLFLDWYSNTDSFQEDRAERQVTREAVAAETEAAQPDPTATPETLNATEQRACRDFRQARVAFENELTTVFEHREALQDIQERTRLAQNRVLRTQGDEMLRAITQGEPEAYGAAVEVFRDECARFGH